LDLGLLILLMASLRNHAVAEEFFVPVLLEQEPLPGAVSSSANPLHVSFQDASKRPD
jgi:hypothetical protein